MRRWNRHKILAGFGYNGVARLKPGVTIGEANADIARMLEIWMDSWTNGDGGDPHFYKTWKISGAIRPMKQEVIGNIGSVLWAVMGTIGVVMLMQPVSITLYGYSFVTILTGTLGFVIVSHFPD